MCSPLEERKSGSTLSRPSMSLVAAPGSRNWLSPARRSRGTKTPTTPAKKEGHFARIEDRIASLPARRRSSEHRDARSAVRHDAREGE